MQSKIKKLLQIGIVVRSLEEAMKNYEEILGIGPWELQELSGAREPFKDLTIDGVNRQESICRIAICKVFGMEIELIEPTGNSQYSRWLEKHGPGLHHIAFETADGYDQLLQTYQKKKKAAPWIHATGMGGLMDFAYLDYREEMGIIMECYRNIQPGRTGIEADYKGVAVTGAAVTGMEVPGAAVTADAVSNDKNSQ